MRVAALKNKLNSIHFFPVLILIGFFIKFSCLAYSFSAVIPMQQNNNNLPIAALFVKNLHLKRDMPLGPDIISEIWRDGTIIWSKNMKLGGPPYYMATLPPAAMDLITSNSLAVNAIPTTPSLCRQAYITVDSNTACFLVLKKNGYAYFETSMINYDISTSETSQTTGKVYFAKYDDLSVMHPECSGIIKSWKNFEEQMRMIVPEGSDKNLIDKNSIVSRDVPLPMAETPKK